MKTRDQIAGLPPREQAARLLPEARELLARLEKLESDAEEATVAVDAIAAWADGAEATGQSFSDLVYGEDEQGLLRRLSDADGQPGEGAWNALTTLTMYVAWLIYTQSGEAMPSDVNEVDVETLDLLDSQMMELG